MKNSMFKTGWFLLFAAGLLAVMSACKKENTTSELRAVMNDFANSNQKAYIDANQFSCFVTGEAVRVNNNTGTITALSGRLNRECSISNVDEANDNHYLAFYPANLLKNQNEDLRSGLDDVKVSFPREQEYRWDNTNKRQIIDNPMMAELTGFNSDNNTLHFRNLCALLKITVCTSDAFDSIRVTMPGTMLWGDGSISVSDKMVIMEAMTGTSSSYRETVVLKLPASHYGSPLGETFYIMIPQVSAARCTVEILNRNTPVKSFRIGKQSSILLEYNKIHRLAVFTFNAAKFSVAADRKVVFSPGNLQWSYTNGVSTSTPTTHDINGINNGWNYGTWQFAPNQYEIIGLANTNAIGTYASQNVYSDNYGGYTGWIDLFPWGGSGYGKSRPYFYTCDVNNNHVYYCPNNNLGAYDWGAFNYIYNPQNGNMDPYGTWRTLTRDEWHYLLYSRGDNTWWRYSDVRFIVDNITVNGLLVYPDSVTSLPNGVSSTLEPNNTSGYSIISLQDFNALKDLGCAFLPSAGDMFHTYGGFTISDPYKHGFYWASNVDSQSGLAYYVYINEGGGSPWPNTKPKDHFLSVRLVRDVK